MKIACPACGAAYEVPDAAVAPGRIVRCARCSGQWEPLPAETVAPHPPLVADPVIEDAPPRLAQPDRAMPPQSVRAAWVVSLVALGLLVGATVAWRHEIMRVWPASGRLYALFGSPAR